MDCPKTNFNIGRKFKVKEIIMIKLKKIRKQQI